MIFSHFNEVFIPNSDTCGSTTVGSKPVDKAFTNFLPVIVSKTIEEEKFDLQGNSVHRQGEPLYIKAVTMLVG